MNNPTIQPNSTTCECGGDHREAGNRNCVVFVILNRLQGAIDDFFYFQDVLEFGKDGPMVYCLRRFTMRCYRDTIKDFEKYERISRQHPEWNLDEPISRLRRYFDQVADDCAQEKNAMARGYPFVDYLLSDDAPDDGKAVRDAKHKVGLCFALWEELIEDNVNSEMINLREGEDPWGELTKVDADFKEALEAIMLLPESEKATAERFTKNLDRIRKETLRLLCEYRPPLQVIYQSGDVEIKVRRR